MTNANANTKLDALMEAYRQECREISDLCVEEGYPSHGSNYEVRCASLWEDMYREDYESLTGAEDDDDFGGYGEDYFK